MYILDEGIHYPNPDHRIIENEIFFFDSSFQTILDILKDIYEIPYYSIIVESPRITYIFVQKIHT